MARGRAMQRALGPSVHLRPWLECGLGSAPGWSSGFLSQGALGCFQRERWSVIACHTDQQAKAVWLAGSPAVGTAWGLLHPKEGCYLSSFGKAGPMWDLVLED